MVSSLDVALSAKQSRSAVVASSARNARADVRKHLRVIFVSVAVAEFYGCELLCEGFFILSGVVDIFLLLNLRHYLAILLHAIAIMTRVLVEVAILIYFMYMIAVVALLLISIFHIHLRKML